MTRAALTSALEALELGDESQAHSIIVSALADKRQDRKHACPDCPNTYEWPGQLAEHRLLIHGDGGAE
jgi:hypothetical protein